MPGELLPYHNNLPTVARDVFLAPGARVIGDVVIGAQSSVWFNAVIRGDVNEVRIGSRTNIQDGTVVHVETDGHGTYIGDEVTIGHAAVIHACRIGDRALIGMKACILDGAVVEPGAMVAAGAVVPPGKVVAAGQLWAGMPARHVRDMKPEEVEFLGVSAERYVRLASEYLGRC